MLESRLRVCSRLAPASLVTTVSVILVRSRLLWALAKRDLLVCSVKQNEAEFNQLQTACLSAIQGSKLVWAQLGVSLSDQGDELVVAVSIWYNDQGIEVW